MGALEHINVTVSDPDRTAQMCADLFGWQKRWEGGAIDNGRSIHVGGTDFYIAVYEGPDGVAGQTPAQNSYRQRSGLNHIGVVVDDLDAVEAKVTAMGFTPNNHQDYEPGRRFYFRDHDDVEWEIVSYA